MHYGKCDGCGEQANVNRSTGHNCGRYLIPAGFYCDRCFDKHGLHKYSERLTNRKAFVEEENPGLDYAVRCLEDAPEALESLVP